METREMGRSRIKVSRIGLGCVTFGREIDQESAFRVADRALEQGITLFDTADVYGGGASETVLGAWLKERGVRDRIAICTKVGGPSPTEPNDRGCRRERILRVLEESLRRLHVECVEFYLTHCWDPATPPEETLAALSLAVAQGKARAIGCSNYAGWQLCRMLWLSELRRLARMDVIEAPLSLVLGRTEMERELRPLCQDQGVGILSYSPLGAGFLTGKYGRGDVLPAGTRFAVAPGHQKLYFAAHNYALVERLQALAREAGVSAPALAIGWVLAQPAVACTLIGARAPEQIDQAFEALAVAGDAGLVAAVDGLER